MNNECLNMSNMPPYKTLKKKGVFKPEKNSVINYSLNTLIR